MSMIEETQEITATATATLVEEPVTTTVPTSIQNCEVVAEGDTVLAQPIVIEEQIISSASQAVESCASTLAKSVFTPEKQLATSSGVSTAVTTPCSTSERQVSPTNTNSNGVFQYSKEVLRCQQLDHDMARVKFLCVDASCKCGVKLACAECILNDHKDHKYVVLEKFIDQLSEKYTKVAKSADALEEESRMEEFQARVTGDVRAEFSEIKALVMKSFDEFEKDYLTQISKYFESSKPRMEHREKFQAIAKLASVNFETLSTDSLQMIVQFHGDDKLEKSIDDIERTITKNKAAISKKKAKYFEKFRAIVSDILANCRTAPLKESSAILIAASPSKSAMAHSNSSALSTSSAIAGQNGQPGEKITSDEKKKRKITFNDDQNIIYETPNNNSSNSVNNNNNPGSTTNAGSTAISTGVATAIAATNSSQLNVNANPVQHATKQSNISELQSFSARSFASETRRFTSSVHKKLKTEVQQQATITSTS